MSIASNPLAKSEPLPPYEYVIVRRTQLCDCCHAEHSWSETYSLSLLKPRLGLARTGSELQRISEPRFRVPITKRTTEAVRIPFCHSCYEPSLANTPNLIDPMPELGCILNSSIQPSEEAPSKALPTQPKAPPAKATAAQIAELLK